MLRALLACLALIALEDSRGEAQTLTPNLLRPVRDGSVSSLESPLRKTPQADDLDNNGQNRLRNPDEPAPSRIGKIPTYGLAAASGASNSGYDSLNRKRIKPKFYPGQRKPKAPPGPGTPAIPVVPLQTRLSIPPSSTANKTPIPPAMAGTVVGQPARKRLKVDGDPFGAVGDYAGSFLIKSALELGGGYDSNPGRTYVPKGSPF